MPTASSFSSSFKEYGVGLIGGGAMGFSQAIFGSGFFGSLVAPILAASVLKGDAGRTIAVVAGFNAFAPLMAGLAGLSGGNSGGDVRGEM